MNFSPPMHPPLPLSSLQKKGPFLKPDWPACREGRALWTFPCHGEDETRICYLINCYDLFAASKGVKKFDE